MQCKRYLIRLALLKRKILQKAEGVVAYFDAKNIKCGNIFVIAGRSLCATDDEEVLLLNIVNYTLLKFYLLLL